MSGLRGVGKTVLLKRFEEIAQEEEGWATASLEVQPRQNNETNLLSALQDQFDRLDKRLSILAKVQARATDFAEMTRRVLVVRHEGFEWSLGGDLEPKTAEVGEAILEAVDAAVKHRKAGLALLLDEAQILTDDKSAKGEHPLSTLIAAVSTLQKEQIPVCLVLCGLPTLAVNLLNARTYTERMFQGVVVAALDANATREAFVEPLRGSAIDAADDLVDEVLREVEGYPYFVQLWGAELWDATSASGLHRMTATTLQVVRERIYERLDLDFYEPRINSLTPAEQDLLVDSSRCAYPPLLVSDLNGMSPKTPGNVNVLLGRLVTANVMYRLRKGQYEYTAPGFREFLQRRSGN